MYFFKFIDWFWTDYLCDNHDRFGFALIVWAATFLFAVAMSMATGIAAIMTYYMIFSIIVIGLLVQVAAFMYMRRRYIQWQSLVFDKLKKQSNQDDV